MLRSSLVRLLADGLNPEINPPDKGYSNYIPYGAAKTVFESTDTEIIISGPAGTGKTRGNLEYLHYMMQTYPGARGLIIRKTRASLNETALQTFEDHVLGPSHPMVANGPARAFRRSYEYDNGSEIIVGGMNLPTRVLGSEYDIIFENEAIELTLSDHEALLTRNRNFKTPLQRIIADTNPGAPVHWIMQRANSGALRMIFGQHEDNPTLYNRELKQWTDRGLLYLKTLDSLTGVRKQRMRYGRWVQAEGAVYEGWDDAVHFIDYFDIPAGWRRIRVFDFGHTNPFVCQWWAIDPDGRMYLYREIYMTQRTVHVHAKSIREHSANEFFEANIADHDAEDRATLLEEGIATRPAQKAVKVGIEKVQERLKLASDGKPRLFIMRDILVERDANLYDIDTGIALKPTCTYEELPNYVWTPTPDGKVNKDEPLKINDHGMDSMRYAVMYVDIQTEAAIYVNGKRVR